MSQHINRNEHGVSSVRTPDKILAAAESECGAMSRARVRAGSFGASNPASPGDYLAMMDYEAAVEEAQAQNAANSTARRDAGQNAATLRKYAAELRAVGVEPSAFPALPDAAWLRSSLKVVLERTISALPTIEIGLQTELRIVFTALEELDKSAADDQLARELAAINERLFQLSVRAWHLGHGSVPALASSASAQLARQVEEICDRLSDDLLSLLRGVMPPQLADR